MKSLCHYADVKKITAGDEWYITCEECGEECSDSELAEETAEEELEREKRNEKIWSILPSKENLQKLMSGK